VRRSLQRVGAVVVLLVLSAAWIAAGPVALHMAVHDHEQDHADEVEHRALDVELAQHGHAHGEETPAHDHPVIGNAAFVTHRVTSMALPIADAPGALLPPEPGPRLLSLAAPVPSPPPRHRTHAVLRI
jgi:hypothetical protein